MDTRKDRSVGTQLGRDSIALEDFHNPLVADYLQGSLPKNLIEVNGHAQAAPLGTPTPVEVLTTEQFVDRILGQLRTAFLTQPAKTAQALGQVIDLAFLQAAIDPEAVRQTMPFNAVQVRAGGFAALGACMEVDEAKAMKVDAPALGKDLARAERVRQLGAVINPAQQILDANESQVLGRIAEQVDGGLERGWSVIQNNGALLRALQPALAIRGQPTQDGLQTRAYNERRDEVVRGDEKARLSERSPAEVVPATTTVTMHAPSPVATAPKAGTTAGKKP